MKRTKRIVSAALVLMGISAAFFAVRPNLSSNDPQTPNAQMPSVVVDGREYIFSSYLEMEDRQPQGFEKAGSCVLDENTWDYYTDPTQPQWVYLHQEIYNNLSQKKDMKYLRYVDSRIRGKDYISWDGSLYVSMWSATGSITQQEYDRVREEYGLRIEGLPSAEFEYVGKAEFSGYDTLPDLPLGCNTGYPEIYRHSTDNTLLLASISWNTAPHGDEDGRHTGFNVYVKCQNPLQ